MPKLIKRFTTTDLLTNNNSVCNPSILFKNNIMSYRDGRDGNKDDNSKLLKIANIDNDFNIINCYTISVQGKILSDPRLLKWNDNIYIAVTQIINLTPIDYLSSIDLFDMNNNKLLGITYNKSEEREKNWIFFEYEKELLCSRSLWNKKHQVLKLNNLTMEDYISSSYENEWNTIYGEPRNTSNFILYNGLMWGCFHSHDGHINLLNTYRCGIFAFKPVPPFNIVKMSRVPLFKPRYKGDIFYPNHLDIIDDNFRIGMGVKALDHFDIITISFNEIKQHITNDITFDYI